MTLLIISPHLDDAVLSYGGHLADLARHGKKIIVYTVFAGSPAPPFSAVAEEYHATWELTGDPVSPRRQEDLRALDHLGVVPVHGDFLDAIYRRGGDTDWLIEDADSAVGRLTRPEPTLVEAIADKIGELVDVHGPSQIVSCSATGDHVDHVRTRDAALAATSRRGLPIRLWEDMPYGAWRDDVPPLPSGALLPAPRASAVSVSGWETKKRAIECYESQLSMLSDDDVPVVEQIEGHARTVKPARLEDHYTELVWDLAPSDVARSIQTRAG